MSSQQITENIINTLIRIDTEAKADNISPTEFARLGNAITNILNKIEEDFGIEYMLHIFCYVSNALGHNLSPLHTSIIHKLESYGFKVDKVHRIAKQI